MVQQYAAATLAACNIAVIVYLLRLYQCTCWRNRELSELSTIDALTGVLNRFGFDMNAASALALARRSNSEVCLLIGDMDKFKAINDRYLHSFGDIVLRMMAESIQDSIRTYDSVGRLGGDEFAVVMPQSGRLAAESFMERHCQILREYKDRLILQYPDRFDEIDALSITWGFAISNSIQLYSDFYAEADAAMYLRKPLNIR